MPLTHGFWPEFGFGFGYTLATGIIFFDCHRLTEHLQSKEFLFNFLNPGAQPGQWSLSEIGFEIGFGEVAGSG